MKGEQRFSWGLSRIFGPEMLSFLSGLFGSYFWTKFSPGVAQNHHPFLYYQKSQNRHLFPLNETLYFLVNIGWFWRLFWWHIIYVLYLYCICVVASTFCSGQGNFKNVLLTRRHVMKYVQFTFQDKLKAPLFIQREF